jgi:NADH pyrophosphatase NudC (nudix superfamily)
MVLIAAVVIAIVAWPLVSAGYLQGLTTSTDAMAELTAQRDAALKAIKDLEFDQQTGKVSADDFPVYDRRLREQALQAMQRLDAFKVEQQAVGKVQSQRQVTALDKDLEAQIAALRRSPSARPAPAVDLGERLEAEIATQRASGQSLAPAAGARRFCGQCGQPLRPTDRFCGACGAAV